MNWRSDKSQMTLHGVPDTQTKAYTNTHIRTHAHMHTNIFTHAYTYMCTCTYTHIYVYICSLHLQPTCQITHKFELKLLEFNVLSALSGSFERSCAMIILAWPHRFDQGSKNESGMKVQFEKLDSQRNKPVRGMHTKWETTLNFHESLCPGLNLRKPFLQARSLTVHSQWDFVGTDFSRRS